MRKKKLGWTDLNLSVIGLGTAVQGNAPAPDDPESIATIRRALELGINWIDTAALYGYGRSEEVVGRAIKGLAEKPIIATKCCRTWNQKGEFFYQFDRKSVRTEIEASLKRLGLDAIDLYQIHWPGSAAENEEAWTTVAGLVQAGKIRYAGVSNFSVGQIKLIQQIHPVASLQPPYNMINRKVEDNLLDFCAENNIGVVTYSPMQGGVLTDKFSQKSGQNPAPEENQPNDPELEAKLRLTGKLRLIAEKYGQNTARLAVAWILRRPEVTAAIVGARRPAQIEDTAPAADWILPSEVIASVETLLEKYENR